MYYIIITEIMKAIAFVKPYVTGTHIYIYK